jgi:hypothetical protein
MPTIQVPQLQLRLVTIRGLELRTYTPTALTSVGQVPLTGAVAFTGYAPTRAAGLLLRGNAPNIALSSPQPGAGTLSIAQLPVEIIDTSPQPQVIPTPERTLRLESWNPIIGLGSESFASSLQLRGNVPVAFTPSPVFTPGRLPLTLTTYAPGAINTTDPETAEPGAGSLVLSGKVPTKSVSDIFTAAPAEDTLDLTGYAPDVSTPAARIITPGKGALALSPYAAVFSRSDTANPPKVVRSLKGKIPTASIGFSYTIVPAKLALTLAGKEPYAILGPVVTPAEGALALAGKGVTATTTTALFEFPPAGALAITGAQPAARLAILPGADALTLASYTPLIFSVTPAVNYSSANTKLISLTTRYGVEPLFD